METEPRSCLADILLYIVIYITLGHDGLPDNTLFKNYHSDRSFDTTEGM